MTFQPAGKLFTTEKLCEVWGKICSDSDGREACDGTRSCWHCPKAQSQNCKTNSVNPLRFFKMTPAEYVGLAGFSISKKCILAY